MTLVLRKTLLWMLEDKEFHRIFPGELWASLLKNGNTTFPTTPSLYFTAPSTDITIPSQLTIERSGIQLHWCIELQLSGTAAICTWWLGFTIYCDCIIEIEQHDERETIVQNIKRKRLVQTEGKHHE
jgi:hypothetical protein